MINNINQLLMSTNRLCPKQKIQRKCLLPTRKDSGDELPPLYPDGGLKVIELNSLLGVSNGAFPSMRAAR